MCLISIYLLPKKAKKKTRTSGNVGMLRYVKNVILSCFFFALDAFKGNMFYVYIFCEILLLMHELCELH